MSGTLRNRNALLVTLVLSTVLIQLAVAVILKELADARGGHGLLSVLFVLGLAVGLNGIRFVIWGYTHRHFPLSHSYPLTALFFPCVLALSAWYGDAIGWRQVGAVVLIMAGVALMNWSKADDSAAI